jgi:nucleoside-diphosphate kinase
MIQRTLVLFKPDTVSRGLVGEILHRFERVGLKIVGLKLVQATGEQARLHYFDLEEKHGPVVFQKNVRMLMMGPVVVLALEGDEAVAEVRKLTGDTYPAAATPGTIRGDYTHISKAQAMKSDLAVLNVIHASSSVQDAEYELSVWFAPGELVDYQPAFTNLTIYGPR